MTRIGRVVAPGVPDHPPSPLFRQGYTGVRRAGITQRGNRREDVFFDDADRRRYLLLMRGFRGQDTVFS